MNVHYVVSPGTFEDFVEHVARERRRRRLMQDRYAAGTLRGKLFPGNSPYLPDEHPARAIRPQHPGDPWTKIPPKIVGNAADQVRHGVRR